MSLDLLKTKIVSLLSLEIPASYIQFFVVLCFQVANHKVKDFRENWGMYPTWFWKIRFKEVLLQDLNFWPDIAIHIADFVLPRVKNNIHSYDDDISRW